MPVLVGGLGGGGDVGLAVVLAEDRGFKSRVSAVASFANCSSRHVPPGLRRVAGALYMVEEGADLGRRVFEDKLPRVVPWARRVYIICAMDDWEAVVEGLEWLGSNHGVDCSLHADIGGDALMTGMEEGMGSYLVDAVARAALAYAAERLGWKSMIAVGAAGGEGGGGEIPLEDLAATLKYLEDSGAILGALAPRRESLALAWTLLQRAESGMLPLYLQAASGARVARVNMAYLHGEYPVKPWYRYVLILDAQASCRASPLCTAAMGRGARGVAGWSRRRARGGLREYDRVRRVLARTGRAEEAIMGVFERALRRADPTRACWRGSQG